MQDLKITSDMILAAVGRAAVEDNLSEVVAEVLGKQMREYFYTDHYGKTDFQRTCYEFIQKIVLSVLAEKEPAIRVAVNARIDKMLQDTADASATALVDRMRKAIT